MDDTKLLRPWVLGGDSRYYWAVKALRESGLPVKTWGVSGMKQDADHLQDALQGANMVLLPMKPFRGEMLCIGEEQVEAALLPRMVEKNTVLIAGSFPEEQEAWLQSQGLFCRSFLELESYQMSNAAVTAGGCHLPRFAGAAADGVWSGDSGNWLGKNRQILGGKAQRIGSSRDSVCPKRIPVDGDRSAGNAARGDWRFSPWSEGL